MVQGLEQEYDHYLVSRLGFDMGYHHHGYNSHYQ